MYNVFMDYEDDVLEIIKTPSKPPVDVVVGKYGIEFWCDINNNVVKISIPEPEILFGVDIEYINNFITTVI